MYWLGPETLLGISWGLNFPGLASKTRVEFHVQWRGKGIGSIPIFSDRINYFGRGKVVTQGKCYRGEKKVKFRKILDN